MKHLTPALIALAVVAGVVTDNLDPAALLALATLVVRAPQDR